MVNIYGTLKYWTIVSSSIICHIKMEIYKQDKKSDCKTSWWALETEQLKSCFSDVVYTSIHPFFSPALPSWWTSKSFNLKTSSLRLSLQSLKFEAQTCNTRLISPWHHHGVVFIRLNKAPPTVFAGCKTPFKLAVMYKISRIPLVSIIQET